MGKKQKKQAAPLIYQAFMSGLPYECSQEDLKQFLGSDEGIVEIKLPKYQDSGKCRGYAHIKFDNKDAYQNALSKNRNYIKSRYITVEPAKGQKQLTKAPEIPVGCKTVFIKGLPYEMSQQQIKKQFGSCGKIVDVRMVRNWANKKFKGFVYIQYKQANNLKKIINKYHNQLYKGRRLICDAQAKQAKKGYKKRNFQQNQQKQGINQQNQQ